MATVAKMTDKSNFILQNFLTFSNEVENKNDSKSFTVLSFSFHLYHRLLTFTVGVKETKNNDAIGSGGKILCFSLQYH